MNQYDWYYDEKKDRWMKFINWKWPTKTEWRYVNDDVYEDQYEVEVKLTVKEIVKKKLRQLAQRLGLQGCTGMMGPKGDMGAPGLPGIQGEKGELDADSLIALLHNDPNVKQAVLALMDQRNS